MSTCKLPCPHQLRPDFDWKIKKFLGVASRKFVLFRAASDSNFFNRVFSRSSSRNRMAGSVRTPPYS